MLVPADGGQLSVAGQQRPGGHKLSDPPNGKRVVVLASGRGTNLEALLAAFGEPPASTRVVLVVSDRPDAGALTIAQQAGIPNTTVVPGDHLDRSAYNAALRDVVAAARPDAVCLAGFMRILGPAFVHAFPNRIVNTHPSLLPSFRGAHAVRDALDYGVKVTGCTVHLVDEEVDHGPILYQEAVEVAPDDDETSLHTRIKAAEHRLLPVAVEQVAGGHVTLNGRHASTP